MMTSPVFASLLLAAASAGGEAAASTTTDTEALETLTLAQVLADVEEASPALVGRRALAEAQVLRADAAGAWSDPFVAVGPDEYGFNEHPPMLRFEVSQAIPLPGTLAPQVDSARAAARAAKASTETTTRSLRVTAIQLFLRGVYLTRSQEALERQMQLLDDIIASAQVRYAAGTGAQRDVLVATAEKASLAQSLLVERREAMMIAARLDALRGRTPRPRLAQFLDDRSDASSGAPQSFDEALQQQPELEEQAAAVAAADARAADAEAAVLPDLIVQGMWMQSFRADEHSTAGAMIGVSVPLFYWWKQAPAAQAALREKKAIEAQQASLRLALAAEWQEASLALRTAEDNVRLYRDSIVPATDAALESTRSAYAAQGATFAELLSLMRTSVAVQLELSAAQLQVRLAEVRLRNLLSSPSIIDIGPVAPTMMQESMSSAAARGGTKSTGPAMGGERGTSPPPGTMMMREMGSMGGM